MNTGAKGGDAPDEQGASSGPLPGAPKQVVRSSDPASGDSAVISSADTAVAGSRNGNDDDPDDDPDDDGRDPLLGTTLLERYSVNRKIGQGGMGAVYEATHTLIGKRVAVKVLLNKYAGREQVVARLEQEARLASSIGHEHIIDITDFGQTHDGRTFVVMEFLDGESLADCLAREGPLPETRILQIAQQIASALAAAHAKGIVHRDVKPENVFLLRRKDQDFVKVVDFGISKSLRTTSPGEEESPRLTQTGMVLGTPLYMSPEQARGDEHLDHRIDIYALGVIMYELATGKVPFLGSNYLSIISQVLNDEPPPPRQLRRDLSEEVEAIILKSLDKDRDRRYRDVQELLADITAVLDDPSRSTQRAKIVPPRRRVPRSGLRILGWIAGVSVVAAAVAVTVSMTMGSSGDAKAPAVVPIDAGPVVVVDAAPATPPVVELVKIPIDTLPTGATIYEGGRVIGKTPTFYEAPVDNDKIVLVASLAGYDDTSFTINPIVDKKRTAENPVRVELRKPKRTGPPQGIRRPPTSGTAAEPDSGGGGDLMGNPFKRGGR